MVVFIHRDPIVDNISLPASVPIHNDFIKPIFLEVLSYEQRAIVVDWEKANLSGETG